MTMLKEDDVIKITYAHGVRFAIVEGHFTDHRLNAKLRVRMLDNDEIRDYDPWDDRITTELDPVEIVRWRKNSTQKEC